MLILLGLILGAVVGSYLSAASWRLRRRIHLTRGRSVCYHCHQPLRWYWNVPVAGWLLLRGRAGCCGARIPFHYPLRELASALVGALIAVELGLVVLWVAVLTLVCLPALLSLATARFDS